MRGESECGGLESLHRETKTLDCNKVSKVHEALRVSCFSYQHEKKVSPLSLSLSLTKIAGIRDGRREEE